MLTSSTTYSAISNNYTPSTTTMTTTSNTTQVPDNFPSISDELSISLYILYTTVLFIGVTGNILTVTVIFTKKAMRRSIHIYTFNLCLTDLMILLFYVPTQVIYIRDKLVWTMGLTMCRASYVVVPFALISTIGTLLAISVDRARGLTQPFKWRADSKRKAKILIPVIWITSILINIPLFIVPRLFEYRNRTLCFEEWPTPGLANYYWFILFVIAFAIPLCVIFILHVIMIYVIMYKVNNEECRRQDKRMIKMTVAVVLVFTICTGLQHVLFFLTYFQIGTEEQHVLLYFLSNLFVSLQASINPILYGTFRSDFKRGYKSIINKIFNHKCFRFIFKREITSTVIIITPPSDETLNAFSSSTNLNNQGKFLLDSPIVSRKNPYSPPVSRKSTRKENLKDNTTKRDQSNYNNKDTGFKDEVNQWKMFNEFPLFNDMKQTYDYCAISNVLFDELLEVIKKAPETRI